MILIIIYEIFWLLALAIFLILPNIANLPDWYLSHLLIAKCTYFGVLGGILYLFKSIYYNKCVKKQWDEDWHIWYYLRPITSSISGFISYIFLKAGLLVLDASSSNSSEFGYYAIAFIAGYNVDNFLKKLESIAKSVWGIHESRLSKDTKENKEEE